MIENGVAIGTTPLRVSTTNTVMACRTLTLEFAGYQPQTVVIQRREWSGGKVVASALLCPAGLWWSADYPHEYVANLVPLGASFPDAAPPAAPSAAWIESSNWTDAAKTRLEVAGIGARIAVRLNGGETVEGIIASISDSDVVLVIADRTRRTIHAVDVAEIRRE